MEGKYDICVDYDTLIDLEHKIDLVLHDLEGSTERMSQTILNSQNFLAGNQFEKAKQTANTCIRISQKTGNNLRHAKEYLKKLQGSLLEYGQCGYKGAQS